MKKKKIETVEHEVSSGNVFADLGFPDAEEMLAKADLGFQINQLIKKKKLTQTQAAKLLDIDQPKVSALNTGKLFGFSLERLFKFLTILGQDITIQIKPKSKAKLRAHVQVRLPKSKRKISHVEKSNPRSEVRIQARKKK